MKLCLVHKTLNPLTTKHESKCGRHLFYHKRKKASNSAQSTRIEGKRGGMERRGRERERERERERKRGEGL